MLAYTGGLFFDPLSSVPVGRSFTVGDNSMKDTPKGTKRCGARAESMIDDGMSCGGLFFSMRQETILYNWIVCIA